jgi:hypothetical protein
MPNWVTNNVTIKANNELLAKIRSEVLSEDSEFDFNTIAPIPTELKGTTSPTKIISQEEYDAQEEYIAKGELTEIQKKWGVSRGLTEKLAKKYKKKYGSSDWYDWQINAWGTKWNACDIYWNEENDYVSFNTAWSTPFALIKKLSEKYPFAEFVVEYADEDFGYNVGTYTLIGGIETECIVPEGGSREAYEMAIEIQGNEDLFLSDDFCDVDENEGLSNFTLTMIEIAYDRDYLPSEGCGYPKNVLEKFKELAMDDENYELLAIIQKELDNVIEEK